MSCGRLRRPTRAAALVVAALSSCDTEPGIRTDQCFLPVPDVPASECTPADEKRFVDGVMRRHYLFNDQLPDLDPESFETAQALLRALVADVEPRDRFSFVASSSGERQFYEEGKVLGLGFNTRFVGDELVLSQVYGSQGDEPPSPASEEGLVRGDVVLAIGGRTVADLVDAGELGSAFGPNEPGLEVDLRVRTTEGSTRAVTVVRDFFVFDPVPVVEVFERDGRSVGYMVLRSFVEPATGPLREAFQTFRAARVDDVVLDLRYNSGGLLSVAQTLADLVAGSFADGELLWRRVFNDDNASCGEERRFSAREQSLERVQRVVALTLGGTASASEQVISGLRPHVETLTVGGTTFGKPVGQFGFSFCEDRVLRPVTFRTVNADGEGDYFEGIPPDCGAAERVDRELGDPSENMLSAALSRLATGTCDDDKAAWGPRGRHGAGDRTLRHPGRPAGAELIF